MQHNEIKEKVCVYIYIYIVTLGAESEVKLVSKNTQMKKSAQKNT